MSAPPSVALSAERADTSARPIERRATRRPGVQWWGTVWFAVGALMGAGRLSDNSFLTHLATGRLILRSGVPRVDPYSFVAGGRTWIVQSWLASVCDALVERVAGAWGIRVLVMALTALLAALIWRLSAQVESLVVRVALTAGAVGLGSMWWNERPQLLGFVALGLTLVVLEERRSPWWLVPGFAVWVNWHGSFPIGLAVVGLWVGVCWAEGRRGRAAFAPVATSLLGVALGGIVSPFGIDQITFPVRLLGRGDVLAYLVEWRRPGLTQPSTWLFAAAMLITVVSVVRARRWFWLAPVLLMTALGATSNRNIAVASVVLVPVLARVAPSIGTLTVGGTPSVRRSVLVACAVLAVGATCMAVGDDYDFAPYPTKAVAWMSSRGLVANPSVRVANRDFVSNYLQWREGPGADTFVDDRAELFERTEIRDHVALISAERRWPEILDRYGIDVVVWERSEPLAAELGKSNAWRIAYRDPGWVVACRRDALVAC